MRIDQLLNGLACSTMAVGFTVATVLLCDQYSTLQCLGLWAFFGVPCCGLFGFHLVFAAITGTEPCPCVSKWQCDVPDVEYASGRATRGGGVGAGDKLV